MTTDTPPDATSSKLWIVLVSSPRAPRQSRWDRRIGFRVVAAPDAATADKLARGRGWRARVVAVEECNGNRIGETRAALAAARATGATLTSGSAVDLRHVQPSVS